MARVLVTGGNGQLGRCLQDRAAQFGFEVIALDASDLDITDKYKVTSFVEQVRPIAIINAAAYTAVDNAEKDYDLTYKVNAAGPQYLAEDHSAISPYGAHNKIIRLACKALF